MTRTRLDTLIREREQLESLTRRDIEALQLRELESLLARERARGGFYRELPARLERLEDLRALPFTTDEDLAHHAASLLLCSQSRITRVLSDATSGTTGAAKRVFYTEEDLRDTVALYEAGLGELVFPDSVTMICFPFSGPFGLGDLIARAVEGLGARPLRVGPALRYGELRELLRRERPDTYVGMPAPLLSMLRFCGRGSLRRALVSGDSCPDSVADGCARILGTPLFPHYGSREMGMAGAVTCPAHAGMHLRENHTLAEIVDPQGQPLPKGAWGELVITTFGMEAMPLLRYRTGDRARILPGVCPCGSELTRLEVSGRLTDGGSAALDEALFSLPELVDYCAARQGETLLLRALTLGEPNRSAILDAAGRLFPKAELHLEAAPVSDGDRCLIPGKRRIAQAVCPPSSPTGKERLT
jgi:phenylacetate-coenzyme A ligase PaaK-like adenylate-forming protein